MATGHSPTERGPQGKLWQTTSRGRQSCDERHCAFKHSRMLIRGLSRGHRVRACGFANLIRQTIQAFLPVVVSVTLGGCSITVQSPANGAAIPLPATSVVVTGTAPFTNLEVTVDGVDISGAIVSTGSIRAAGSFPLATGPHTVRASATFPCWFCPGGTTQSTDTNSFTVLPDPSCPRAASPPVITFDAGTITVAQRPGRQLIAYALLNGTDGVQLIVDDAPGLPRTSMLVEVDLDPNTVRNSKMIEAWNFCHRSMASFVTSGIIAGNFGEGLICSPVSAGNDYRSGCTSPNPPMRLDQATTNELWLRKQGVFGNWDYAEVIDQSIWLAFGGRRVRFLWIGPD